MRIFLLALFLPFFSISLQAQTLSSMVVDSVTQEPIPYATIRVGERGSITNEEGRFTIVLPNGTTANDTLFISSMGYESIGKPIAQYTEKVVALAPKAIALNNVIVSNKQYTGEELIDLVQDRMDDNYSSDLSKRRVFFRDAFHQHMMRFDYTFIKSTIDVLNKPFMDSIIGTLPRKSSYYTEILGDLYGDGLAERHKLKLIKASELYDKNNMLEFESVEKKFNEIIQENVKPNSYFKIKSGILPLGKVEGEEFAELFETPADSTDAEALKKELEKKKESEKERKTNYLKYRKNAVGNLLRDQFFHEDTPLDFIQKSRKYEFDIKDFTYMGDAAVYIVGFKPKRSADYRGTLYIDSEDFAILRVDYENTESLRTFKLLGVGMDQYLKKGKQLYAKNAQGKYTLQFLEQEQGTDVSVKRPIKIIELNKVVKGRNKQNELSGKIDMKSRGTNKQELVIFDEHVLSSDEFGAFEEKNNVLPKYMPKYDPSYWEGHAIIEPNKAIRDFTAATPPSED
ncbi:MAG: carboxypeptidase-like regulatory domain-containing protein [Flavobacteriaceae bacterium]